MKKNHILFAGLIVLMALLLCAAAAAAPLTTEEILARKENGEPITEEEAAEYLDSLDNMEKAQDLSLGANYTLDGRTIRLSGIPLKVSASDGSNPQTVYVQLENSYYKIADDVILVHDADGSLINGRPAAGTRIGLGSGIRVDSGSSELREGSKVLLLEKNGGLHAFYAGVGTDSNTLVTGNKLYIMRCFQDMQVHTPNGGIDIDIDFVTIMFPDGSGWIKAGEKGTLNINIDVDSEYDIIWFGPIPIPVWYLYLNDCSMGITLPNLTIHAERYAGWYSIEIPLVKIEQELDYGFMIDMSPTFSLEGEGEGDTVLSMSAREGFRLTITDLATVTDIEWKHTDPTFELVDTDMEGELYYGFAWGPALTWVEVAGFGGFYKTGVVVSAGKSNNAFNPDNPDDPDWHVCGKDNCLQGTAFTRDGPFSANIVLVGGIVSIPIVSTDPYDYPPFVEYYISKTFGEKSFSSLCPHWAWRLNVQVVNQNITPIPNAKVYYKNVPEHYEDFSSATTDSGGNAVLCTTTGNIEVVAELANPDDPSHPYTASVTKDKKAMTETLVLELDLPSKYVYFKNSASGEATEWPEDISFIPAVSREVKLPDTVPELSGRVFTGWNTAEDGSGTSYNPGTKLTLDDDLTLWAQWVVAGDSWYVVYNAHGGTWAPSPDIVTIGSDAIVKEAAQSETLRFEGWSTDPEAAVAEYQPGDTLKYDSSRNVVILYALWQLNPPGRPWVLSFKDSLPDPASGLPPSMSIDPSVSTDAIIPSDIPEKSGRLFTGWNTAQDGSGTDYAPGSTITLTGDTTLWAQWTLAENTWVLVYDANGGTDAPSPSVIQADYIAFISVKEPVHEDMKFLGWALSPDATEAEYHANDLFHNTEGKPVIILYAVWQPTPPRQIHITFEHNGLYDASLPPDFWMDAKTWVQLGYAVPPVGSGYTFLGWDDDPFATDPTYLAGHSYVFKWDMDLYAIWSKQETVTLTFLDSLADSATGIPDPITIVPSESRYVRIPSQIPQKSGRVFTGWNTAQDGTGTKYAPGSTLTLLEDTTLWAQWDIAGNSWYVIYDANGGTKAPGPQIVPQGQDAVLTKELPENGSLTFMGWATAPDAATAEYQPGDTLKYDSGKNYVVLYALWQLDPSERPWVLTFRDSLSDAVSGIPAPISIDPSVATDVRIPSRIPEKSGRVFAGWNTAQDGSGTDYAPGSKISLTGDATLWAQWDIAGSSWYILYDANGGTKAPAAQIVPQGQDAVLTKELPESGNLTFMGWAANPDAAAAEYQPGGTLKFDSGKSYVVLYAVWELDPAKRPTTVSFDANGGLPDTAPGKVTAPKGVWVQLPVQQPSWDAQHDFLGWSADPKAAEPQWKAGSTVLFEKDTKLYAVWYAHYKVIEGAGSVWTKGSGKTQRFVADGDIKYFKELRVDGLPFNDGVQISSGSTIADISAKAMEKLSNGDHTVTFVYQDGIAAASFTVRPKTPPTGDAGRPGLWIALIALGIAGLVLPGVVLHTKGRKK